MKSLFTICLNGLFFVCAVAPLYADQLTYKTYLPVQYGSYKSMSATEGIVTNYGSGDTASLLNRSAYVEIANNSSLPYYIISPTLGVKANASIWNTGAASFSAPSMTFAAPAISLSASAVSIGGSGTTVTSTSSGGSVLTGQLNVTGVIKGDGPSFYQCGSDAAFAKSGSCTATTSYTTSACNTTVTSGTVTTCGLYPDVGETGTGLIAMATQSKIRVFVATVMDGGTHISNLVESSWTGSWYGRYGTMAYKSQDRNWKYYEFVMYPFGGNYYSSDATITWLVGVSKGTTKLSGAAKSYVSTYPNAMFYGMLTGANMSGTGYWCPTMCGGGKCKCRNMTFGSATFGSGIDASASALSMPNFINASPAKVMSGEQVGSTCYAARSLSFSDSLWSSTPTGSYSKGETVYYASKGKAAPKLITPGATSVTYYYDCSGTSATTGACTSAVTVPQTCTKTSSGGGTLIGRGMNP